MLTCLVEIILCSYTSGFMPDGTFQKKPVCDEFTEQRGAVCKIVSSDDKQYQVDCYDDLNKRYDIADNKLNKIAKWTNKDLCR